MWGLVSALTREIGDPCSILSLGQVKSPGGTRKPAPAGAAGGGAPHTNELVDARFKRSWPKKVKESKEWELYVLEGDKGLYIGISQNFYARLHAHRKGECKTSARLGNPRRLRPIFKCHVGTYKEASKLEDKLHSLGDGEVRELIEAVRYA